MDPQAEYAALQAQFPQARKALQAAAERAQRLLPSLQSARARGWLQQQIWDYARLGGHNPAYYSQAGQDAWLDRHYFRGQQDGRFVEIGGYDGLTGSNCLFFEQSRGWEGMLIEPSPSLHAQAVRLRRCPCHQLAIAAAEGEADFLDIRDGYRQMGGLVDSYDPVMRQQVEDNPRHAGEIIRVPTRTLPQLLDEAGWDTVDYISLDVEGGERAILEGFPFDRFKVRAWTVENNRGDTHIPQLMQSHGYQRAEALGVDDVYIQA